MKWGISTTLVAIVTVAVVLTGIGWAVWGNSSGPDEVERSAAFPFPDNVCLELDERYARLMVWARGCFDMDTVQDLSGRVYYAGRKRPSIVIAFSIPQPESRMEVFGDLFLDPTRYPSDFLCGYGVPTSDQMDYYNFSDGDGTYWPDSSHPHLYCGFTRPNGTGRVDVYYLRLGG